MRRLTSVFASLLLLSAGVLSGCYDNHSEPSIEPFALRANANIALLYQLAADGCYNITSDIVCVGRVTSSDRDGNFYRSMFVEDETGAVEVKLGTYNIAAQYPVGVEVALRLKGTAVMFKDNILQIGLPPQSYDIALREFEAQEVVDRHILRGNSVERLAPLSLPINSLGTSLCGRFVQVENIYYKPTAEDKKRGFYRFENDEEYRVFVEISPYSNFSTLEIPASMVSIQGILYHKTVGDGQGRQFVIKPRFADDISTIATNL